MRLILNIMRGGQEKNVNGYSVFDAVSSSQQATFGKFAWEFDKADF